MPHYYHKVFERRSFINFSNSILFELYSFLIPSVYFKTILLDKIEKLLPNWDQWKLDALWTALNKIII